MMKTKISILIIFFLFGCRSVQKTNTSQSENREKIEVVKSDSIVKNTDSIEKINRNSVILSSLNFKIIPGMDTIQRTYAIQDKNGNIIRGQINPTDTLEFSNDVVSIEAFQKMKELKEYYEHRSLSAEKRYNELLKKSSNEVERKPQPIKWIFGAAIGLVIVLLIIRLWK